MGVSLEQYRCVLGAHVDVRFLPIYKLHEKLKGWIKIASCFLFWVYFYSLPSILLFVNFAFFFLSIVLFWSLILIGGMVLKVVLSDCWQSVRLCTSCPFDQVVYMICYMQSISTLYHAVDTVTCTLKSSLFLWSCVIYTSGSCAGSVMILKLIETYEMCMRALKQLCIREIFDLVGIVGNNVLPFLLYFCC